MDSLHLITGEISRRTEARSSRFARSAGCIITTSGELPDLIAASSYGEARALLEAIDEERLRLECDLIRGAFMARRARSVVGGRDTAPALLAAAAGIAREIYSQEWLPPRAG